MSEGNGGTRRIETGYLARVEGEGAMYVRIRGDEVLGVELRIFEPPRLFEALLRGRALERSPRHHGADLRHLPGRLPDERLPGDGGRARDRGRPASCATCAASSTAASGSRATPCTSTCCTRPTSSATRAASRWPRDHREVVERGLRAKKAGNRLIAIVGGREVHPINVRVGGFYRAPERRELEPLRPELERCRDEALETVRWVAGLDFPELERDYELVSLRSPVEGEYPIDRGRIVSSKGIDIAPAEFDETFEEEHVPHSTALHARVRDRGAYLAGPMARFNLNLDRLSPLAAEAAAEAGLGDGCRNPFRSIVVRAVEILYAFDEALRLIDAYEPPGRPGGRVRAARRVGHGVSEAPRGLLYHRYEIDRRRARSPRPGSCRPPPRTSARSRRTCASSSPPTSPCPTRSCATAASRRSATTTPASPARPTSCELEVERE